MGESRDQDAVLGNSSPVPLLMAPIRSPDPGGAVIGVVYALQKKGSFRGGAHRRGYFDENDERGLEEIADEIGRSMARIGKLEEDAKLASEFQALLNCSTELLSEVDLRRLIRIISRDVCQVTKAEHCSTYIVDHIAGEVWTQVEGLRREIRLPKSQGIVGKVATTGDYVRINEASEFKGVLVGDTNEIVQSVLCCPVLCPKGSTLAVIQAFHAKEHFFSDRHVTMVQQLAKMAGKHPVSTRLIPAHPSSSSTHFSSSCIIPDHPRLIQKLTTAHPRSTPNLSRITPAHPQPIAAIAVQNQQLLLAKSGAVQRGVPIEMDRARMHHDLR